MAKEMNVKCNFVENNLMCVLPEHTMDVLLKVRTRSGEHTFWEDVYTRTLKYRRWNNELRPFQLLKKRVVNMFRKRNLLLDSSRGTSTQTIVNNIEQCKMETRDKDSETDSDRDSIHSNWSELIPINNEINKTGDVINKCPTEKKGYKEHCIGSVQAKAKRLGEMEDKISLCN